MFLTQLLNLLHQQPVEHGNGCSFIRVGHVVGGICTAGCTAQAVSLIGRGVAVAVGGAEILPGHGLPAVVVAEDGQVPGYLIHHHGFRRNLTVDTQGFQNHQLGGLGLKGTLQQGLAVGEVLAAAAAHVAGISGVFPDEQGGDGEVRLAVSHHYHVNGIFGFSLNAVGDDLFHTGVLGVVLGNEEKGQAVENHQKPQGKGGKAQEGFCDFYHEITSD